MLLNLGNVMKATELRVGNWINIYDDYNSKVTGLTNTGKIWFVDNPTNTECAFVVNKIEPIPLTEEWLVRFGFENEGNYFDIDINGYSLSIFNLCEYSITDTTHEQTDMWIAIKHVHQLQNLYFALTNKEL